MTTTTHTCHHCGGAATLQWQRQATTDEATQHWDAVETNIRESGNPDYTQNRTDSVVKAVFGCDTHPDPAPGTLHAADCGGHGTCQCGKGPGD